jgi:hypothetical protein
VTIKKKTKRIGWLSTSGWGYRLWKFRKDKEEKQKQSCPKCGHYVEGKEK